MINQLKYQNQYRIKSSRLKSWDYRQNGAYFITICTKDKFQYFGKITENEMQLSHIGILADVLWYEIKSHFSNIEMGDFVVMPNHVHGILLLNKVDNDLNTKSISEKFLKNHQQIDMAFISPKKGSISTIVRSYKAAVSKHAHRLGFDFSWQSRFYDHIIRNQESYNQIADYIKTNPQKWEEDKFYVFR